MKLVLKSVCPVNEDIRKVNVEHARSLGFPRLGMAETTKLAVVGGGTSIVDRLDELRAWDGDIWAINGAHGWLRNQGLDPWFFTVDPTPEVAEFAKGATKAIVAMDCHPALFEALSGAYVEAFEMADLEHGPTTSTAAPHLALLRGYRQLVFYGCEGSFGEHTHAYGNFGLDLMLKVKCDGEEFLTGADMMVQVEYLGEILRKSGKALTERSGGLLAAYVRSPDIDVLAAAKDFHGQIMEGIVAKEAAA